MGMDGLQRVIWADGSLWRSLYDGTAFTATSNVFVVQRQQKSFRFPIVLGGLVVRM
ncbi:MAG: hypothetical protein ACKOCK_10695 [Chloroflexota bacterium]